MEIQSYSKGNEGQILNLFARVFHKEMTMDFWKWRFDRNPFSNKKYISLYWKDNDLIGHYAASPIELLIDGKMVKSAISMTTMTDPAYQGLGIFPMLTKEVNDALAKDDFQLIWGFPNSNSHYGLVNGIGWEDVGLMPMLSLSVSEIRNLKSVQNGVYMHGNFNHIDASLFCRKDKSAQINKTIDYLNWRYVDHPINEYYIIEVERLIVVYKVISSFHDAAINEIDIVEVSAGLNYSKLKKVLSYVLEREEHISKINVWCSIFDDNVRHYERIGFRPSLPITHFCLKTLLPDRVSNVGNLKNWDLSLGYSDVF